MKIMTWNVDWFRNCKRSGEKYEYRGEDYNNTVQNEIEEYLKDFLQKQDSIAIIQEYPEFLLNKEIRSKMGDNTIMYNKRNPLMRTIALCPIDSGWLNKTKDFYDGITDFYNRVVVVEKNGVKIIGVHIPDLRRNGDSGLWNRLIEFCEKYNPDVICGDFNTDCEYIKNLGLTRSAYIRTFKVPEIFTSI